MWMLTSFVNLIPIKDKKTETVINAYIKYTYADKGGSKFIPSDKGKNSLVPQWHTLQTK